MSAAVEKLLPRVAKALARIGQAVEGVTIHADGSISIVVTAPGDLKPEDDSLITCRICRATKTLDQFYKHKGGRQGRSTACKACTCKQKAERIAFIGIHGRSAWTERSKRTKLHPAYVADLIRRGTTLTRKEIPLALVEVKRAELEITREIKRMNDATHS